MQGIFVQSLLTYFKMGVSSAKWVKSTCHRRKDGEIIAKWSLDCLSVIADRLLSETEDEEGLRPSSESDDGDSDSQSEQVGDDDELHRCIFGASPHSKKFRATTFEELQRVSSMLSDISRQA